MADSSVAITPGSGALIDARTEATNGHYRQVIVIGDPDTNAGVAPVDAIAGLKVDLGADNDVVVATRTTGGASIFRSLDLDESEEEVKATAGTLYGGIVFNLNASSNRYLKFYNATAANVTVGTTTPVMTVPIPPNTSGFIIVLPDQGLGFSTAITVAATTGLADNDTGAPSANEVVVNLFYA